MTCTATFCALSHIYCYYCITHGELRSQTYLKGFVSSLSALYSWVVRPRRTAPWCNDVRGHIIVLRPGAAPGRVCECYQVVKDEHTAAWLTKSLAGFPICVLPHRQRVAFRVIHICLSFAAKSTSREIGPRLIRSWPRRSLIIKGSKQARFTQ